MIQEKLRFEIGAGSGEFNFADAVAKIQPLALFARRAQKARQPAAEISGFADIQLAIAAKEEDGGPGGEFLKKTRVLTWRECERAREHKDIVVAVRGSTADSPIARLDYSLSLLVAVH